MISQKIERTGPLIFDNGPTFPEWQCPEVETSDDNGQTQLLTLVNYTQTNHPIKPQSTPNKGTRQKMDGIYLNHLNLFAAFHILILCLAFI